MDEYADALLELADYLVGRFSMADAAAEYLGLDVGDMDEAELEEALLSLNVEHCPECGNWAESGDLVDDEGDFGMCSSCREG